MPGATWRGPAGGALAGALVAWALAACAEPRGPKPEIGAVSPDRTCDRAEADTRVLHVSGSGLSPMVVDALGPAPKLLLPTVQIQRTRDTSQAEVNDPPLAVAGVTFTPDGGFDLRLPGGLDLSTGSYDVVVTDGNGSVGRRAAALQVTPPPVAFYVDPQRVWAGAALELTAWLDAPVGRPSQAVVEIPGVAGS